MFANAEIAPENLPAADAVDWQALDRRFVARLQVGTLINVAVIAAGLVVVQFIRRQLALDIPVPVAWAVLALASAAFLYWPRLSVPRKGYAVRERDIIYRTGVFWQTVTAVPFNRIQHVETASTPLDRRFGLASLQVYTAGSAAGDLRLHGLPAGVAERLRVFVLEQAGGAVERD